MVSQLLNVGPKAFWFTESGMDVVLPPKQPEKEQKYFYLERVTDMVPALSPQTGMPIVDPLTQQPKMVPRRRTELKSAETSKGHPGAKKSNTMHVPDHTVTYLKSGEGVKLMRAQGINPKDILFGTEVVESLQKDIELKQLELANYAADLESKKSTALAAAESEIQAARAEADRAREEARLARAEAAEATRAAREALAEVQSPAKKPQR